MLCSNIDLNSTENEESSINWRKAITVLLL